MHTNGRVDMTRINVGCGATPTDGWLNFDNSPICRLASYPLVLDLLAPYLGSHRRAFIDVVRRKGIRYANVVDRIPVPTGSVRILYSSHMFDQLALNKLPKFLKEARRILAPRGYIRIGVVDLRIL